MRLGMMGPLDHWEHELRMVSKSGLVDLVEELLWKIHWLGIWADRESLLKMARKAKASGRLLDHHNSHLKLMADMHGELKKRHRKSVAAKKAARRRKREQKGKA